ncbi:M48 family metallopeptidase [Neokomagataea thailandica]|uniref:M48 family metallopeptidase n=1 Tax=Neokomagataea TaxID=1223423 RepID=UPI00082F2D25|nr:MULTISPECIES: SprT family zinc-dependent metalloprotease [Neokomagataea]
MVPVPSVQLRPSKRARRITLRADPTSGCVIAAYPAHLTQQYVRSFIRQHEDWINKANASLPAPPFLGDGGSVLLNGVPTPIYHAPMARQGCVLTSNGLQVSGHSEHVESRVQRFLRALANKNLPVLLQEEAQRMNAHVIKIDIRNVRSRWGSCTRAGRIMLSWRLIMCPPTVQSYIMVHELSHLTHFDHSPAFWGHVDHFFSKGCSGRLAAERWLRQNGPALLRVP